MKVLMRRIVVFGGLGLLLSMVVTACTLSGTTAAPLATAGPGGITPLATPTSIGLLPTPLIVNTPGDIFGDLTATAASNPFGVTPVLETPIGPGVGTTPFLITTPLVPAATVTPLPPLPINTPTPRAIVATPTAAPSSGGCPPTYTVQEGDNLYRIALRFGLTYQELASANGITNPDELPVGTVLKIPGCGGNVAPTQSGSGAGSAGGAVQPLPGDTVAANGDILHTVKAGENLFRIALSYGLRWEKVAAYNGITDPDDISVGQVIHIPPN